MSRNDVKRISMVDTDTRFYLPDAKILTYSELSNIKKIEDLLPRHKSYFILLYPVQSESSGHWVCLTRFSKMIEYYDLEWLTWVINILLFYLLWYEYKAMRHFYGQARAKTIVKFMLAFIARLFILIF